MKFPRSPLLCLVIGCLCLAYLNFNGKMGQAGVLDIKHRGINFTLTQEDEGESMSGSGDALRQIVSLCGELCDLTKPINPPKEGGFMGTVKAQVNCDSLFSSDILDRPSNQPPKKWGNITEEYQKLYNHNGQVKIGHYFLDNAGDGGARKEATVFSRQLIEEYMARWKAGHPKDTYRHGSALIDEAAQEVNIEGKNVLVIGSQNPWVEAVLLTRNPAKIVTLEYGHFISEHPTWEIIQPHIFRARYEAKSLEKFDFIFTYSSVEHSGLGRYGDALNPFGDIITIARSWCVSTPEAKLLVGVPTGMARVGGQGGQDSIQFNAHRIYGPILYPYLTTNWRFIWPTDPKKRETDGTFQYYQPVFIFEKNPQD